MFTPDTPITVTRIQVQMPNPPAGCFVNARVRLTDGTTAEVLTVNRAHEDSGPLTINYAAGTPLSVHVSRAAACGAGVAPADANVVVQYKAR